MVFANIPECLGAESNLAFSESAIFRNKTSPSVYDKLKRPTTAYTTGAEPSNNPGPSTYNSALAT